MRALALVALLAGSAIAGPKSIPPQVVKAARGAFEKARAAEDKGDLNEAIKQYQRAYEIEPHPNVLFNLADVWRRQKNIERAIETYEKYLASEGATDRAAVQKIVAQLKKIPGTLNVECEEPDGIMFIDGKRSGAVRSINVTPGTHVIDVITPITHGHTVCDVDAGRDSRCW